MIDYVASQDKLISPILEPCVGDGRFVDALLQHTFSSRITAVELYAKKTQVLSEKSYPPTISIITSDFLDYALNNHEHFNLIIGNPPYINIKNMSSSFLKSAKIIMILA